MYRDPDLVPIRVRQLTADCPEAGVSGPKTRRPTPALERWKAVNALVAAWLSSAREMEELVGEALVDWNPADGLWIRRLAMNAERILDREAHRWVSVEGDSFGWVHQETGHVVSVAVQFSTEEPNGTTDHYRLKTGRTRTDPTEAAVLAVTAADGERFWDLALADGTIEEIAAPDDPEAHLRDAFDTSPTLQREGVRPGWGCVMCDRTVVCGAYPLDGGGSVGWRTESITLTKTDLEHLARCERRVAWKRVHQIPRDDGGDADDDGRPAAQGRMFHDLVSVAHEASDADRAVAEFLRTVPASEVADMQTMWDNHRSLLTGEGLTLRRVEFPVGGTLGTERLATVIGFADATTVDADGTPVIIELKTGQQYESQIESDVYAMGMARWHAARDRTFDRLRIHRHFVRPDPPVCVVVEYTSADIEAATSRLAALVETATSWPWDDPLAPEFSVDTWCDFCEFRSTCENFRGPHPPLIDTTTPAFD